MLLGPCGKRKKSDYKKCMDNAQQDKYITLNGVWFVKLECKPRVVF